MSEEAIADLFHGLDSHSDEEIAYSDFLAATIDQKAALRDGALARTFHRLDADHSGKISPKDLKATLGETIEGEDTQLLFQTTPEVHLDGDGEMDFPSFCKLVSQGDARGVRSRSRGSSP